MIGISIKPTIGIGDALQFSSLPENYFRAKGEKLIDLSRPWFFDNNPFVERGNFTPDKTIELWNFGVDNPFSWPNPRKESDPKVYLSNAEIWASVLDVPVTMNRLRLYRHEEFPYFERKNIIVHFDGNSHGDMPEHIVQHIISKYGHENIRQVGFKNSLDYGLIRVETKTLWELAEVISKARMFIGVDSGPSWIAACYPDVIVKKVRTKPNPPSLFHDWVPLNQGNIHSFWDDRAHIIHNVTDHDIGFTFSYRRI